MQRIGHDYERVDITPHPRILRMLGEIAFEPHKCIGELIDNSIDAFLNDRPLISAPTTDQPEITITVPHKQQVEADRGQIGFSRKKSVQVELEQPYPCLDTIYSLCSVYYPNIRWRSDMLKRWNFLKTGFYEGIK